jgi:hypothetical protein
MKADYSWGNARNDLLAGVTALWALLCDRNHSGSVDFWLLFSPD